MIKIKNMKYSYKDRIVSNIKDLEINDGEKIAFMGLNGSGKTTLAEIILKIKNNYKGSIEWTQKYRFNAVFQDQEFMSEITLKEIFYLYCDLYKLKTKLNHETYFQKYQLLGLEKHVFKQISGGQKQKFKFMIALLNNPEFLLLDEISTGLDYVWRTKIIELIKNEFKNNDKNLILISHNPEEIVALCDRVILLKDGEVEKDFKLVGTEEDKLAKIESLVNINV